MMVQDEKSVDHQSYYNSNGKTKYKAPLPEKLQETFSWSSGSMEI